MPKKQMLDNKVSESTLKDMTRNEQNIQLELVLPVKVDKTSERENDTEGYQEVMSGNKM